MPTYEYECCECGTRFDVFQSIKAAPARKMRCEACGRVRPVRRLIGTGGAVLFKGSGFHETDYRSKSYRDAAKKDKEAVGKSPPESGAKPDKSSTEKKASPSTSSEKVAAP